jgi:voltage-gated potassium channel
VVVTTHDDDMNIYLTLYCRRLRPDVQLLGRVAHDRNLSTMHRAGADFVLSYASTGATEAWNTMRDDSTVLLAEGLLVFRIPMPPRLAGRRLSDLNLRTETGCSVIGVARPGQRMTQPDPAQPLPTDGELVLLGDDDAERHFLARYVGRDPGERFRGWLAGKRSGRVREPVG